MSRLLFLRAGKPVAIVLLIGVGIAAAVNGCGRQLPGDEVCRDIGYSIASKYFECTGDPEASNAQYEHFMASRSCLLTEDSMPSELQYSCSSGILALTCAQIADYGENYDRWLGNSGPGCKLVYPASDGGALPPADPDAGPDTAVEASSDASDSSADTSQDSSVDAPEDVDVPDVTPAGSIHLKASGMANGALVEVNCIAVSPVGAATPRPTIACQDKVHGTAVEVTFPYIKAGTYNDFGTISNYMTLRIQYPPGISNWISFAFGDTGTGTMTMLNVQPSSATQGSFDVTFDLGKTNAPTASIQGTVNAVSVTCFGGGCGF